ncbi:CBN-NAS-6 protein [Aphelenchoides avenae]|nr:CBN-NAS-6 protein [Aphelenchus avenae]
MKRRLRSNVLARTYLTFVPFLASYASAQLSSLFHSFSEDASTQIRESQEPMWMRSGKFQGDIDGVDVDLIRHLNSNNVMMNALKNKQLLWTNGVVPYELDEAFTQSEVRLLEKAFKTFRKRTCIRFRPHTDEADYLYVTRGYGCYSQVGQTGGKQEISLGRGCLFHEIILHETMHSLGFWHEHSRADRDDHIRIQWENILPGMDSQFDIISSALQDTLGIDYDYRSIMHYDSAAFSKNGKNTIETKVDGFTSVIGTAMDLSELDVAKINRLYKCHKKEPKKQAMQRKAMNSRKNSTKATSEPSTAKTTPTTTPRLPFKPTFLSTAKPPKSEGSSESGPANSKE